MKRTSMTRDEQERWAVSYLAANLSREEVESAETSITVQAFADFFAAQWPRTFNKMAFAAKVRAVAMGHEAVKEEILNGSHLTKHPTHPKVDRSEARARLQVRTDAGAIQTGKTHKAQREPSVQMFDRLFTLPRR